MYLRRILIARARMERCCALYRASRYQHSNNCAAETSYTVIIAIIGTPTSRRTEAHPGKPSAQTPLSFLGEVETTVYPETFAGENFHKAEHFANKTFAYCRSHPTHAYKPRRESISRVGGEMSGSGNNATYALQEGLAGAQYCHDTVVSTTDRGELA